MTNQYVPQNFPKWKYKNGETVLVLDADAEKSLGAGWKDAPHDAK